MNSMGCPFRSSGCDGELEPVECVDPDVLAALELAAVAAVCMPELAADEHEVALSHSAFIADDRFRPGLDRAAPRGEE